MTDVEKPIVYIIGHKIPDTDSICAAIAYAYFKNKTEPDKEFKAMKAGPVNEETKLVLERFNTEEPPTLEDATGKKVILLDHNESAQAVNNIDKAEILGIVDHHPTADLGEKYSNIFHNELIGSTSAIIAEQLLKGGIEVPKQIASLLLSAILSDTVMFRLVTTKQKDRDMVKKLNEIVGIDDLEKFTIEIKKAKADISQKTMDEVIYGDYKDYNFSGNKVGIGQVETVDLKEAQQRKEEIIQKMAEILQKGNYHLMMFMLTDIMKQGTDLLVVGETAEKVVQDVFGKKLEGNAVYIDGLMARKKQIAEPLQEYFAK